MTMSKIKENSEKRTRQHLKAKKEVGNSKKRRKMISIYEKNPVVERMRKQDIDTKEYEISSKACTAS